MLPVSEKRQQNARLRPVVFGIGLYFLCAGMDSFRVGAIGSVLKVVALVPLSLAVLDIRNWRLRVTPVLTAQLLFWIMAMMSVFYSLDPARSMASVRSLTLNLCLVFCLGLMEAYTEAELAFLQRSLLLGGWVTVALMFLFSDVSLQGRLTLLLGGDNQDQNYINGYFLYAFSWHCTQLVLEKKKRHILPAGLILVMVLLTGSRGALVAFLLVVFVIVSISFAQSPRRYRNLLLVVLSMGLLLAFLDLVLSQIPQEVAQRYSWEYIAEKGTTGRTRIWRSALDHYSRDSILRMLFGHGYGTGMLTNMLNGRVLHNLYLDNLMTLGLVGVVLQVVTQGSVLRILRKEGNPALLGAYCGMIGMCMSLSLVNYKPIWNTMLLALAMEGQRKRSSDVSLCGGSEEYERKGRGLPNESDQ